MMMDIFSLFDPSFFATKQPLLLPILLPLCMTMMLLCQPYFPSLFHQITSCLTIPSDIMNSQLSRTSSKSLKGLTLIISSIFALIISVNLLGMAPYSFSSTSHLFITLSMGLPVWLSLIISSFTFSPRQSTAHLLPDGAPDWLNPFLILIETSSILVRPLTLSFRLAANMTAGHVVLSLLSNYTAIGLHSSPLKTSPLLLICTGYTMFEFAICLIQAYIFCLLLSLYSDDHAH